MCLPLLMLALLGCSERITPSGPAEIRNPPGAWKRLLEQSVTPSGTDYDRIQEQREVLDAYLSWMGNHGPEEDRMRYSQDGKKIAFLINAYNAAVIAGVLEHREISSVMDLSIGLFPSGGAGFFLGQTFRVDGEWVTLYHLEHQYLLGDFEEPLIHAGLNCASVGCPPLRYYSGARLDDELESSMRDYLASEHGTRKVGEGYEFTELMSWYADQLTDWSDAEDICAYLAEYSEADIAAWLSAQERCAPTWFAYDWSLNDASPK